MTEPLGLWPTAGPRPYTSPDLGTGDAIEGDAVDIGLAHARPVKRSVRRLSKVANARETVRGFGHDVDVIGLTMGQFSLLDLIHAALDYTGPADVDIATWSAGLYDIEAARRFREEGRIRRIRFVMDSATEKRGQASAVQIDQLFGADAIRTTRSHAKFALLYNADWGVVITSSMNLNLNPRVEQFEMTDDRDRCDFFRSWVDAVWLEVPAGGERREGDRQVPRTATLEAVEPVSGVTMGRISIGKTRE